MPILAQVGSGDGVTKASMIPDTSSSTIMPSASVIVSGPPPPGPVTAAAGRDR